MLEWRNGIRTGLKILRALKLMSVQVRPRAPNALMAKLANALVLETSPIGL